jgi:hypothetical protein
VSPSETLYTYSKKQMRNNYGAFRCGVAMYISHSATGLLLLFITPTPLHKPSLLQLKKGGEIHVFASYQSASNVFEIIRRRFICRFFDSKLAYLLLICVAADVQNNYFRGVQFTLL